jgi:hypothetical protein
MTLKIIFSGRVMCYILLKAVGGMKKAFICLCAPLPVVV